MSDITRKFHLYRTSLIVVPLLVVAVLGAIGWFVWDSTAGLKGSGTITSQSTTDLSAVGARITGEFDATVIFAGAGEPASVRVTTDDNIQEFIAVEQRDQVVDIRFVTSVRPSQRPEVWITLPEVAALGADQGANITVALGGSDAVEVAVDGGSTVNMTGAATTMALRAGGNSRVDLSPASVLTVDLVVASTTQVTFGVVGRVSGTVLQASTVVLPQMATTDGLELDETSDVIRR